MWFIGVEVEQETSAPPPEKNPGSAPGTAQVVETSLTVNNNSPIQDYVHPDDQTQPTFKTTSVYRLWLLFDRSY